MKLYLLSTFILVCSAQVSPLRKFQLNSVWNPRNFTITDLPAKPHPSVSVKTNVNYNVLNGTINPFIFTLDCRATSLVCAKVQNSLVSAGNRIASILTITTPILVNMTYYSFCDGESSRTCSKANVLGQSAPNYLLELPNTALNTTVFYPPSLLKNSNILSDKGILSDFDIIAEFNADMDFFFPSDGTIQRGQFDFEYVICHEITHGLGFQSGYISWGNTYAGFANFDVFAPQVIGTSARIRSYAPLYAMDLLISHTDTKLTLVDYYKKLLETFVPNLTISRFFNGYTLTKEFEIGNFLLTAATSSKLVIISPLLDGRIKLYCPNPYSDGSSISHIDYDDYKTTPDFLMTYNIQLNVGKTLNDVIITNSKTGQSFGIYGPATLNILKAMGWSSPYTTNSNGVIAGLDNYGEKTIPGAMAFIVAIISYIL